jgi:hypothetical protein
MVKRLCFICDDSLISKMSKTISNLNQHIISQMTNITFETQVNLHPMKTFSIFALRNIS